MSTGWEVMQMGDIVKLLIREQGFTSSILVIPTSKFKVLRLML